MFAWYTRDMLNHLKEIDGIILHSNLGKLLEHMDDIELEADTFSFPAMFSLFVWILPDPIKSGNCRVVEHDWTVKYRICICECCMPQQILDVMFLNERISPLSQTWPTYRISGSHQGTKHQQNTPFPFRSQRNAYKWPAGVSSCWCFWGFQA